MIEPQCSSAILIAVPNLNICTREKKCDSLRVPHTLQEDREEERGERGRGEDGVTNRTIS